ncbi:MAG TPA: 2-succinyl-6-hydroxy-2,4-cyclohexadiene-1-carboxylate synthase [Candidatus Thermoplasmatota archaeon]|nr:2-succinyl-6-hydroxy-2,4-cyclohexadiene-1-carboxylate synthase [Candidatus Thermoplasmatota archaeon]
MHLNVEDDGHVDGRPALALLHGFTGSLEDWDEVAPLLRRRFRVMAVDLVGHGRSDAPDDVERYRPAEQARQLATLLDSARVPATWVCGYSLGARVALHLALAHPARVERLVLESASPGIEDAAEREARRRDDAELADLVVTNGIEAFVDAWMARPFLAASRARVGEAAWAWQRADRLRRAPDGLRGTLLAAGQGAEAPLTSRLPDIRAPTTLVVGEEDAKYRALAGRMAAAMPRATTLVVPRSGHAPHRENPAGFLEAFEE